VRERRIKHRANMTIRKHESITINPRRIFRIVAKNVKIKRGENIRCSIVAEIVVNVVTVIDVVDEKQLQQLQHL
jgi:hypothetical protein